MGECVHVYFLPGTKHGGSVSLSFRTVSEEQRWPWGSRNKVLSKHLLCAVGKVHISHGYSEEWQMPKSTCAFSYSSGYIGVWASRQKLGGWSPDMLLDWVYGLACRYSVLLFLNKSSSSSLEGIFSTFLAHGSTGYHALRQWTLFLCFLSLGDITSSLRAEKQDSEPALVMEMSSSGL